MVRDVMCRLAIVVVLCGGQAAAADLALSRGAPQCSANAASQLLLLSEAEIEQEVWHHFTVAKAAMSEADVIGSRRPAFTWANETRIACGKAAGYLQYDFVDEDSVTNCDCFYQRFLSYR